MWSFWVTYPATHLALLQLHIDKFWDKLLPKVSMESDDAARDAIHSNVRCEDIISILKSALLDPALIKEAKEALAERTFSSWWSCCSGMHLK